jgi:mannosyl-oligosaccharide alpha-1,3-glucosidase
MNSALMHQDPFTLKVALDREGEGARGEVYLDDGVGYGFREGGVVWREFVVESVDNTGKAKGKGRGKGKGKGKGGKTLKLSSRDLTPLHPSTTVDDVTLTHYTPTNSFAQSIKSVRVERVVVLGLASKPVSVTVEGEGRELKWEYTPGDGRGREGGKASVLEVKDPRVLITKDWDIVIQL